MRIYRCPECSSEDMFYSTAETDCTITGSGTLEPTNDSTTVLAHNAWFTCIACGHEAAATWFSITMQEHDKKEKRQ